MDGICYIGNFKLTNVEEEICNELANGSDTIYYIYSMYINSDEFKNYLSNLYKDNKSLNDKNNIKGALKKFFEEKSASVLNSVAKNTTRINEHFLTINALLTAYSYTAKLITDMTNGQTFVDNGNKLSKSEIINEVSNTIIKEFFNRIDAFFNINKDTISKDLLEEYENLKLLYNNSINTLANLKDAIKEFNNRIEIRNLLNKKLEYTNEKKSLEDIIRENKGYIGVENAVRYNELKEKISNINKKIENIKETISPIKNIDDAINEYADKIKAILKIDEIDSELIGTKISELEDNRLTNYNNYLNFGIDLFLNNKEIGISNEIIKNKNFAALAENINNNTKEWFTKVFELPILTSISSSYSDIIKNIEQYSETGLGEFDYEEENNDEDLENGRIDNGWDREIKNFIKAVDGGVRQYLSGLSKLHKSNGKFIPDTDNELGVNLNADGNLLTAQILLSANYNSITDFIESIKELSNIKGLECLSKMYNDMINNPIKANYFYCQFYKCPIKKTQTYVQNGDVRLSQSNTSISDIEFRVFNYINNIKKNFEDGYEEKDTTLCKEINEFLKKNENKNLSNNKQYVKYCESVIGAIKRYIPIIQNEELENYIKSFENNICDYNKHLYLLNDILYQLCRKSYNLKNRLNYIKEQYKEELKDYYIRAEIDPFAKLQKPTIAKLTDSDFSDLYEVLRNLATYVSKSNTIQGKLNSSNAAGNQSSDLIAYSWITNMIKKIKSTDENNKKIGLEALKTFFTKGNFYKYSTILYGIKGIREGLFIKNPNGNITVNEEIANILDCYLFNGTIDTINKNNSLYNTMFKGDYFMNILIHYANNNKIGNGNSLYFMRTPSDASKNYAISWQKISIKDLYKNGIINTKHNLVTAFVEQLKGEINIFINQALKLHTTKEGYIDENNDKNLFDKAHLQRSKKGEITIVGKNGELVGNFFQFVKLFDTGNVDSNKEIKSMLSLYGEDENAFLIRENGHLKLNTNYFLLDNVNGNYEVNLTKVNDILTEFVANWISRYIEDSEIRFQQYDAINNSLGEDAMISRETMRECILNYALTYMEFDDIFEGSTKYYSDAQEFLKRAKEAQMAGTVYCGGAINEEIGVGLKNYSFPYTDNEKVNITVKGKQLFRPEYIGNKIHQNIPMTMRTGFRVFTIKNTVRGYDEAQRLYDMVYNYNTKEGMDKDLANKLASDLRDSYIKMSKLNDAQSYITLEEWIRRRYADGTFYQYEDLVNKLLDPNVELTTEELKKIEEHIQCDKNVYYDLQYDVTNDCYYPRQIKNAEFVLIPKLLDKFTLNIDGKEIPCALRELYDIMIANDIGQVNTEETTKAAKKNILTYWHNELDEKTGVTKVENKEDFIKKLNENPAYVENYYYSHLYRQQLVPQHMQNETNKIPVQLIKKLSENISKKLPDEFKELNDIYVSLIKSSYLSFIDEMGWKENEEGVIVNKSNESDNLDFTAFYAKAKAEAVRLGLDSNSIEYFELGTDGLPKMPNFMSNVSTKIEQVFQSLFNNHITRQTLPGYHCVQITNVGFSRRLKYFPEITDKNGKITQVACSEALVPRWSKLIPEGYDIKKLEEEGLDIQVMHYMPIEGKQSCVTIKIVGFLPESYGSTIVLANELVAQTGKDFDIDSCYVYVHELYKDKNGIIRKFKYDTSTTNTAILNRYIHYVRERINNTINGINFINNEKQNIYEDLKEQFNTAKEDFSNKTKSDLNNLYNVKKEAFKKLSKNIKKKIREITQEGKENNKNFIETNIEINNKLKNELNKTTEGKRYLDIINSMAEIISGKEGHFTDMKEDFIDEVKQLQQEAINSFIKNIEDKAKEVGLLTLEEFSKLSIEEQNSDKAKRTRMVELISKMLMSEASREETITQSGYDDLMDADAYCRKLLGEDKLKRNSYNILDQIEFMNDVISGRQLKAFSVNRDSFLSICNILNIKFGKDFNITVKYDLDETDDTSKKLNNQDLIELSYNGDIYIEEEDKTSKIIQIPYIILNTIISGGQTGIDQLGLQIGKELGIETKGNVPKGFVTENTKDKNITKEQKDEERKFLEESNLIEINEEDEIKYKNEYGIIKNQFEVRTWKNVKNSHGTVYFNFKNNKNKDNTGYNITKKFAKDLNKPFILNPTVNDLVNFIIANDIHILNIAGNRQSKLEKENLEETYNVLKEALLKLQELKNNNSIQISNNTITINHNRLGNSNTDRNVSGKLITIYGSQTTSHILDAVKVGPLINENKYTFGVFKLLADLGIDYYTALKWLYQPGITKLVNTNDEITSVFTQNNTNPITSTIKKLLNIDKYTSNEDLYSKIINNEPLNNIIEKLYGFRLTEEKIHNIPIIIDNSILKQRLLDKKNNIYNLFDIAVDLITILQFSRLKSKVNTIENIMRTTNPDKFGAKQSINETIEIIDNIDRLFNDETLVTNKNVPLLQALYPTDKYGNILVNESKFPYLAAYLKYSTLTSININSNAFILESKSFRDLYTYINESLFGDTIKKLNNANHKTLTKYIVNYIYKNIPFINLPLTVSNEGYIMIDNNRINPTLHNNIDNQIKLNEDIPTIQDEINRIYGFTPISMLTVKIKDINNPTNEELINFNKLSPYQKVLFINRYFKNSGIFSSIEIHPVDTITNNTGKYTYMRVNDQFGTENLINQFREAFFNKNPLIRLTAIDLIKYVYICEGNQFGKGRISKIITNDAIRNDIQDFGLNIIATCKQNILSVTSKRDELTDYFVRSHPEIITTISIPKNGKFTKQSTNYGDKFLANLNKDEFFYIPIISTENNDPNELVPFLSDKLNFEGNNRLQYVNISRWKGSKKGDKITTLYKIIYDDTTAYFIPLNLLNENEINDVSINNDNNIHISQDTYMNIIETHKNNISTVLNNENLTDTEIKERLESENKEINKEISENKTNKTKINKNLLDNNYLFQELLNGDEDLNAGVKKLIRDIKDTLNSPVNGNKEFIGFKPFTIVNNNYKLKELFKNVKSTIQHIEINDTFKTFEITKVKTKDKQTGYTISEYIEKSDEKVKHSDIGIGDEENLAQEPDTPIFRDSHDTPETNNHIKAIKQLYNNIERQRIFSNNNPAEKILSILNNKGIDFTNSISINNNLNDLYDIFSKYYTELGNNLLNKIEHFKIFYDGEELEFNIGDKKLYEILVKKNDNNDKERLMRLILDCMTFGDQFAEVLEFGVVGENNIIQNAINSIQKTVKLIRNNISVNKANSLYINEIFKEESTNPFVKTGLITLTECFHDASWFDLHLADAGETANKVIQVTIKHALNILNTAKLDAEDRVKEFYEVFDRMSKLCNMDKVIDSQGKYGKTYDDKIFEDRQQLIDIRDEAKRKYGEDSLEYYKAKLDLEEFMATNFEQEYKQEYYLEVIANKKQILEKAPELFIQYNKLIKEIYRIKNSSNNLSREDKNKIIELNRELSKLTDVNSNALPNFNITDELERNEPDNIKKARKRYNELAAILQGTKGRTLTEEEQLELDKLGELLNDYSLSHYSIEEILGEDINEILYAKKLAMKEYITTNKKINEKYFEYEDNEEFNKNLIKYTAIIDNFNNKNKYLPFTQKMENEEYREAYEWIQNNTYERFSLEDSKKINKAFTILKSTSSIISNSNTKTLNYVINSIINKAKDDNTRQVVDEFGIFHPERLTEEEIKLIREETIKNATCNFEHPLSYGIEPTITFRLIKDIPKNLPIYQDWVYNKLLKKKEKTDINSKIVLANTNVEKAKVVTKINNLLSKGVDYETGHISTESLIRNLSKDEFIELGNLYNHLKTFDKKNRTTKQFIKNCTITINGKKFKKQYKIGTKVNQEAFNIEYNYYLQYIKGTDLAVAWQNIFTEDFLDKNKVIPNFDIYGYFAITDENGIVLKKDIPKELVNEEKTNARDFINNNLEFVPVSFYYEEMDRANKEGRFKEWMENNHYYDPITNKVYPLKIWTEMRAKENAPDIDKKTRVPKNNISQRGIKQEYSNKIEDGGQYVNGILTYHQNYDSNGNPIGKYYNGNVLSKDEIAMIDYLKSTMLSYATSISEKKHTHRGYAPRERKEEQIDMKWILKQTLASVGLEYHKYDNEFDLDVDYVHQHEIENNMMQLLKGKGTEEFIPIPEKETFETDEEYIKRVNEIKTKNKEIQKKNLEIDNQLLNKNWREVFANAIRTEIINQAKDKCKNPIFLAIESIKHDKTYERSSITGNLIKNRKESTESTNEYRKIAQVKNLELFQTWARRFIYNQYKKPSKLNGVASMIQNITSAKYMIFNLPGGIANVNTGLVNILAEAFAKEYFELKELIIAEGKYIPSIPDFIKDMWSKTSNNLLVAICKKLNIVNYEEMLERNDGEGAEEYAKRVRDLTYGFLSGGEHYMQNTAAIAMLESHRLIKDEKGRKVLATFNTFTNIAEFKVIENLINTDKYNNLKDAYNAFFKDTIKDKNKLRKYDELREDFVIKFIKIYSKGKNSDLIKDFKSSLEKERKTLKEEFEKSPKAIDLFELKDGYAISKKDNEGNDILTNDLIGYFVTKARKVNDKIHGVYTKLGGAKIETEWWGNLVTQYHKHIYPGIMKRYRIKGMYNEIRETKEKGSYISVADFLSIEFKDFKSKRNELMDEKETSKYMASIQQIGKCIIDTIINFRVNWMLLPEWEKNNIKRTYGDLCGIVASLLIAVGMHIACDEDELKEDSVKGNLLSTIIYLSDRLYSETRMYTPWGMYNEAGVLYSSPIAASNGPEDLIKGFEILVNTLFNENYNPIYTTGLYKGQNKASVVLLRNIPGYRVYKRMSTMSKNNQYYRVNDNSLNMRAAKNIASIITGE